MKRSSMIALAGFCILSGAFLIQPSKASAAQRGSVSMYDACRTQYEGAYDHNVYVDPSNWTVFGWRCQLNHLPGSVSLDVSRECKREYGSRAVAKYEDYNNPYSWYCLY